MANADQINAISELVMNLLRGTVPVLDTRLRCSNPMRRVYAP